MSQKTTNKTSGKKTFKPLSWHRIANSFSAALVLTIIFIFSVPFYQKFTSISIDSANPTNPAIALAATTITFLLISTAFALWRFSAISGRMIYSAFKFKEYNVFGKIFMPIVSIVMALFGALVLIATLGFIASLVMGLINNPEGKDLILAGRLLEVWKAMTDAQTGIGAFFIINFIANLGFVVIGMVYIFIAWIAKKRTKSDDKNNQSDQPIETEVSIQA